MKTICDSLSKPASTLSSVCASSGPEFRQQIQKKLPGREDTVEIKFCNLMRNVSQQTTEAQKRLSFLK